MIYTDVGLIKGKKVLILFFAMCFRCQFLLAQNVPAKYIAYHTMDEISIDGKANEQSWNNAPWTTNFIDISTKTSPRFDTKMKMLWDKKNLYFYVTMEEPHVWGNITQRDAVIFHNNDFEVFIDPDGDTHNYYEFEINALNTVWDLMLSRPYRYGAKVDNGWNIKGLQSAIHVDGTLNNPTDIDKGWSVEIAMPWKAFKTKKWRKLKPKNNFWRFNFSRVQWKHTIENNEYSRELNSKTGKPKKEDNWVWSPQGVVSMHIPEKWGYVYFSDKKSGETDEWEIPTDEHLKRELYKSFYAVRGNKFINNNQELDPIQLSNKYIMPKIIQNKKGWVVQVKSPFTNKIMNISQDGKFTYNAKKNN